MYKYFKVEEIVTFEDVNVVPRKQRRRRIACKDPQSSEDIPNYVPYLLIGSGIASFSAFRSIKTLDPKAQVLIITKENEFPYIRTPLSKEVWYDNDPQMFEQLKYKQWNGKVSRFVHLFALNSFA